VCGRVCGNRRVEERTQRILDTLEMQSNPATPRGPNTSVFSPATPYHAASNRATSAGGSIDDIRALTFGEELHTQLRSSLAADTPPLLLSPLPAASPMSLYASDSELMDPSFDPNHHGLCELCVLLYRLDWAGDPVVRLPCSIDCCSPLYFSFAYLCMYLTLLSSFLLLSLLTSLFLSFLSLTHILSRSCCLSLLSFSLLRSSLFFFLSSPFLLKS